MYALYEYLVMNTFIVMCIQFKLTDFRNIKGKKLLV